jgi:dolichol-phosphate mannosyltransferase
MSFSIILPTLNEQGHIKELIYNIEKNFLKKKIKYEIIVIDDNSIDQTAKQVKSLKKKNIKIFIRHNQKKNLADSINLGIKKSIYNNIIWMDADFQHPPEYIKKFIKYSEKFDVIIFSRFLKKSQRYFDKDVNTKEFNENQSILFNKICNFFFYKDLTDYTSGFILIKKDKIKDIKLKGYYGEYFLNLLIQCKLKKFSIKELSYKERLRKTGLSKTGIKLSIAYIYLCLNYFNCFLLNLVKKNLKINKML